MLPQWCAELDDVLIIGTHFATPTAGSVKRRERGGYWLDTTLAS